MAKTSFATNNPLTKKAYDEKLFRDSVKSAYFSRFMGENSSSLVHTKTQLEKSKGDQITFGIRMRLTGPGVTSGMQLEGNEEKLTSYDFSINLERYRQAVRDDGALSRQRAMFDIDEESEQALKDWGAEKIDQLCFDALGIGTGATTDPTRIYYLNSSGVQSYSTSAATAKAALHATNSKLSLDLISFIKAAAKTGGNRSFVPLRPVKVDGKEYYILLAHPDALYDLKASSEYKQAQRDAQERGKDNPLFTGADAIWNGVVIHEHENCAIANDGGGASVSWSKAVFMGAQSLVWAWGERPKVIKEKFDYQEENGYAWAMTAKCGKPKFNSLDYGSLGVYLARTKISDL